MVGTGAIASTGRLRRPRQSFYHPRHLCALGFVDVAGFVAALDFYRHRCTPGRVSCNVARQPGNLSEDFLQSIVEDIGQWNARAVFDVDRIFYGGHLYAG